MRLISLCAFFFVFPACDVDEAFDDGGVSSPAEPGPAETREDPLYRWVFVEDLSVEMNAFGAPGVDICGLEFDCGDGLEGVGVEATLWSGDGEHCAAGGEVNGEPCYADRDDADAAVGVPQAPCEADSDPSHYVALGVGGVLAIRLDTEAGDIAARGLVGCAITVHERTSRDVEAYQVSVCVDAGGVQCLQPAPIAEASAGGELEFVVPML